MFISKAQQKNVDNIWNNGWYCFTNIRPAPCRKSRRLAVYLFRVFSGKNESILRHAPLDKFYKLNNRNNQGAEKNGNKIFLQVNP